MDGGLAAALDRLGSAPPGSAAAPFAVRAVFERLAALLGGGKQRPGTARRDAAAAVRRCLDSNDKEVVEEAVRGLGSLVQEGAFDPQDALDALLSSLYAAASPCCWALISGIAAVSQVKAAAHGAQPPTWGEHPLSRAVLARADSAPEALSAAVQLLLRGCSDGEGGGRSAMRHLAPFFSHLLLRPSAAVAEAADRAAVVSLAAACHSHLVRVACGAPAPLQVAILSLLVSHLPMYRLDDPAQRGWVLPGISDCLDALDCVTDGLAAVQLADGMAAALLGAGVDLACRGLPVSPVVMGLGRLAELSRDWADEETDGDRALKISTGHEMTARAALSPLLEARVSTLGLLSLRASGPERARALALLTWTLQLSTDNGQGVDAAAAGTLLVPALHAVALQPNASAQRLGAAVLAQLRQPCPPRSPTASKRAHSPVAIAQREASALSQAETLLRTMLTAGVPPCRTWAAAFEQKARAMLVAQSDGDKPGDHAGGRWSPLLLKDNMPTGPANLSFLSSSILAALLGHPSSQVQCAAAEAAAAAAQAAPLCGASLLPVVLFQLQQAVEALCAGRCGGDEFAAARACHSLLAALASLGTHTSSLRAVLAAIQPLATQERSSELLRCVAMRLLLRLWRTSGKAWPPLRALLLPSSEEEDVRLRLARAACVRDVCEADGQRGVELVKAIEEALRDAHPGVAALGMAAIVALCHGDDLDFYAAWQVVVKLHPKLPAHPLLASKWVALLACGALDAQAYPEAAAAIVELLWSAASHPSRTVRQEAYLALAAYPIQLLQLLELEVCLRDYSLPVISEEDRAASAAAQELAGRALAHEGARRLRGGAGGTAAAAPPGSLHHRLTRTLPRQLCRPAASARSPVPSPGALLLCYLPPAPSAPSGPGGGKASAAAAAARELADGYQRTFQDVASTGLMGAGPGEWEARHQFLVATSWAHFLARWLKAIQAAISAEASKSGQDRPAAVVLAARAAQELWAVLKASWENGELFCADSAAMAAGCLAAAVGPEQPAIVSDVLGRLSRELRARGSPSSQRVAAAALGIATAGLHPTEWQAWSDAAALLQDTLSGSGSSIVRASAAEALGGMVGCLAGEVPLPGEPPSERSQREAAGAAEGFAALLSALAAADGGALPLVYRLLAAAPPSWAPHMQLRSAAADALPEDLLAGKAEGAETPAEAQWGEEGGEATVGTALWTALGLAAPALLRRPDGGLAAQALFRGVLERLPDTEAHGKQPQQQEAAAVGPLLLLGMLAEPLLKAEMVEEESLHNAVHRLRALLHDTAQQSGAGGTLVVGAAAEALGSVAAALVECGSQVRDEGSVAQALASALSRPSASIKASAALGCAALLGAPVSGSDAMRGRRTRQHLVAAAQEGAHGKAVLSALEEAALKGMEPRGQRAAAWALAILCAALRRDLRLGVAEELPGSGSDRGGAGPAGAELQDSALLPLYTLPAEGAMRELALYLGTALKTPTPSAMACTAAALRCLSRVERLPVMNWGALCRRLMRGAALADGERRPAAVAAGHSRSLKCEVRAACASLALKHGHRTSLGLGELLDELMEAARFSGLEAPLQAELLEGLPALLSSLSTDRGLVVIRRLPALLAASPSGDVHCAAWRGLAAYLSVKSYTSHASAAESSTAESARVMPRPLLECLSLLHNQLPPPPAWHGGMWASLQDADGAPALWAAALECLSSAPAAALLELLPVDLAGAGEASLWAVFSRASLAHSGKLALRELQPCKTFCIDVPWHCAEAVAMAVAHAYVSVPQAAQDQCLRDTLNTIKICSRPLQAFTLAACMAVAWAAAAGAPDEAMATAYSAREALAALPYTLPALLQTKLWRPSIGVVAEQLLAVLQARTEHMDARFHAEVDDLIWACLVALRRDIPSDCWSSLANILLARTAAQQLVMV